MTGRFFNNASGSTVSLQPMGASWGNAAKIVASNNRQLVKVPFCVGSFSCTRFIDIDVLL